MLKNWLWYLFLLLCTGAFFVCFNGYLSMYVFLLSLLLPPVSLLVSLPGMLRLRLALEIPGEAGRARMAKSMSVSLRLHAATRCVLPTGRVRVTLFVENRFTGETRRERLEFSSGRQAVTLAHSLSSNTCGLVTCQLKRAWAYDLLGLFFLPVRLGEEAQCQVTVLPTVHDARLTLEIGAAPQAEGERYSLYKPGGDPSELFGLREYRPGDRLSRIDWKLSQKSRGLLVRQASLPITDQVVLLTDLSGGGAAADGAMDVLATLSDYLAYQEVGHVLAFSSGEGLACTQAQTPEEARPAIEAMLGLVSRNPLPDLSVAALPEGVAHLIYICSQPDPTRLGQLRERYPHARLTALHFLRAEGGGLQGAQLVRVRLGHIAEDLNGLAL